MTVEEAADRVAIRELIDAYAHCADRRDADGQMALFTADTHFVVYMDARSSEPQHGTTQPGGARTGLRRSGPLRRDDAFQRSEHDRALVHVPQHASACAPGCDDIGWLEPAEGVDGNPSAIGA
jgi:hypothetical protein